MAQKENVKVTFEDSTNNSAVLFIELDKDTKEMNVRTKFYSEKEWAESADCSTAQGVALWILSLMENK